MRTILFFIAVMVLVNGIRCEPNHCQGPVEPVNMIPTMAKLTFELPTMIMPIMHKLSLNPEDDLMSHDDEFLNLSSLTFRDIFNNTTKNWTVAA